MWNRRLTRMNTRPDSSGNTRRKTSHPVTLARPDFWFASVPPCLSSRRVFTLMAARSVVFRGTPRCPHCLIAPRWCICEGARQVALPFGIDVLMHNSEAHKPTSTGNLIRRIVTGARQIDYHNQRLPRREDAYPASATDACSTSFANSGPHLWILHPRGNPLEDVLRDQPPGGNGFENLRVLLIDGTWAQANDMLRHVDDWGRKVSLPPSALRGESRYWLRSQHHPGHFSTIEALMGLLDALGCKREHDALRVQFELHVYACLLARGQKTRANAFFCNSPIAEKMPELIAKLNTQKTASTKPKQE